MLRRLIAAFESRPDTRAAPVLPMFQVLPDDVMRERERPSFNRLPDLGDWEPGVPLTDVLRDMWQPVGVHRKSWEYGVCVLGMQRLGMVTPEARAIAVGAGSETPLYYFANRIALMVATDLYNNPDHEGTPLMLTEPERFAPYAYPKERLRVLQMPGDKLDFEDASFDFAFCLSSIEHFGSRDTQRASLNEMVRVVRPGGVLCIITELILTEHYDGEYFRWEELDEMFLRHPSLELVGGEPDFSISESLVRYPTDILTTKKITRSPHVVLKREKMLWTSFSMFLRKRA